MSRIKKITKISLEIRSCLRNKEQTAHAGNLPVHEAWNNADCSSGLTYLLKELELNNSQVSNSSNPAVRPGALFQRCLDGLFCLAIDLTFSYSFVIVWRPCFIRCSRLFAISESHSRMSKQIVPTDREFHRFFLSYFTALFHRSIVMLE